MNSPVRTVGDLSRRGYSEEEISSMYELGRLHLENGNVRGAEAIFAGHREVAPEFYPALLGFAYIQISQREYDAAVHTIRQALRLKPDSLEAMLYLVACLLTVHDYNAAGTILGEVGEVIESGEVENPNLSRFYRAQLARYQTR